MDRTTLLKIWEQAWTEGLWYAPWGRALESLTPRQAVWTPQPGRNSIWVIVNHMLFWREAVLRRLAGQPIGDEERDRRNFEPAPADPTDAAWRELVDRYTRSHDEIRAAIANESNPLDRLMYIPYHDSYHLGQIMYLRAMQGLPPID